MKIPLFHLLFAAFIGLAFPGCALTNFNQAALDTLSEGETTKILEKNPADLAAVQALAAALPTAIGPNSSLDSKALGTLVMNIASAKDMTPASQVDFVAWLDGVLRNYNAFQGGANGGPPTVQAALAAQVLAVIADGMNHAVVIYKTANHIP